MIYKLVTFTMDRSESPPAPKPIPDRIAAFLAMVRVLLGYGKHLDATLPALVGHSRFPVLAVGFGTLDLRHILAHIERGILRATMLQRYLLARAKLGREIEPSPVPGPAAEAEIEALDIALGTPRPRVARRRRKIDPDNPVHFSMPTLKELESQVRRRSIGRTIAEICLDLGITPGICDGGFWNDIDEALRWFGGNFAEFSATRARRNDRFKKESDRRPDTWTWKMWEQPKDAVREMLGYAIGESPPEPLAIPPPTG
ncbi:MAG: hypothetical protein WCI94_16210 [Rhodospirillales bacterium]